MPESIPLDVSEIRSAFALAESLPDKIRRFRDDRVAKIIADETPIKLSDSSRVVLHILPLNALNPTTQIETASLVKEPVFPIYSRGYNFRHNFDGLLTFYQTGKPPICRSYLQFFRTGAIEAVCSSMFWEQKGRLFISGNHFEKEIISALSTYLKIEENLQVPLPLFVMLTLVGVIGYRIYHSAFSEDNDPIDRNNLFLPDIIVEDYDVPAGRLLRPAFDALWQASGFERSPSYNKEGDWEEKSS